MFKFLFNSNSQRGRRQYSKEKIRDLDLLLDMETKKIKKDPDKSVLKVLLKNGEHIIVYRVDYDKVDKFGVFYIALRVINKRGVVLNRIRLSANYVSEDRIDIYDLEVFGDNQGKGYGSILLNSLINIANGDSVKTISGWISKTDEDHFDKLDHFYRKHGFDVIWDNSSNNPIKAADIIWTNSI